MEGQASTPRARMTSASLLVLALLPKLAQAVGDYACVDTSHCATDWKDTPLSSNATCVPGELLRIFLHNNEHMLITPCLLQIL
jgi:hypothetical protein